jgi:hypothetical protein
MNQRFTLVARMTVALAALASLSCRSMDRFDTREGQAFCGSLVAAPSFHDGFVADGSPAAELKMKLTTIDTSQINASSDNRMAVIAYLSSNGGESGLCAPSRQALFEHSPVRSIPQLDHDTLSTLTFGEGHDEDFFAWTDSTCQGTMLALVSLLRKGDIELRLFKPAPPPDASAPADKRPGFALFYLSRNTETGCGF